MHKFPINKSVLFSFKLHGELFEIILKRPIVILHNTPAIINMYGFMQSYEEKKKDILTPSGTIYNTREVTRWFIVENKNNKNWRDAQSMDEKKQWVTSVKLDWIDYVNLTDEQLNRVLNS
jgi:hypothetical protein